ncbi:AraC family transcriptional regulator [Paenibacillus hodogayensis]|uniref:AraC family transcriptional regulator n=1 Tax=Paenibacillus hodogayensis TaxID=279208 RepID=A0ABV5W234_9BACL
MTEGTNPIGNVTFRASKWFNKVKCEPGWDWKPAHGLPDYDLWYALEGSGEMRLNGHTYPIRRGSCFIVHPGDRPHAVQNDDDRLTVIFIHFWANVPLDTTPPVWPRHTFFRDVYPIERLLHEMLYVLGSRDSLREEEFDCWMKLSILHIHRHHHDKGQAALSARHQETIRAAIDYIRRESGRRVRTDELAGRAGMSQAHLNIVFKQFAGMPLKKYITLTRLERARYLLSDTTMNVSEVADAIGYSDVYTFSKIFKRYFGMTPSYYQISSRVSIKTNSMPPDR